MKIKSFRLFVHYKIHYDKSYMTQITNLMPLEYSLILILSYVLIKTDVSEKKLKGDYSDSL